MLAELAAFNAAYATVKATLKAGRDITDCAKGIGQMIGAQEELQARGERKQNSIWSALAGKDTNDFEEFMALEKIKTQRAELLQTLQLYGRAGLKGDYLKFEAEARKKRREEAKALKAKKMKMLEWTLWGVLALCVFGGVGGLIWMALYLRSL